MSRRSWIGALLVVAVGVVVGVLLGRREPGGRGVRDLFAHAGARGPSVPSDPTLAAWAQQMQARAQPRPVQPPHGNDSSISPVALPLSLVRTRPGRTAQESSADIGVNAGSPQTYRAGAILANGARLAGVYADHVLLEKNHRVVVLYCGDLQGSAHGTEDAADLLSVGGTPLLTAQADSQEPITDYIRPAPVYHGTALAGYQVYAGRQSGVFGQLGLQPGDVITAIDGTALTDASSALGQLDRLLQGEALTATIQRKTGAVTVSLDGALIAATRRQQTEREALRVAQVPGP